MTYRIELGDCLDVLRGLPDDSVDAVVTDPPYGIGFMGRAWDHGVPGVEYWREVLRVAKPGAHVVAFGGTRTYHRLAVAIEDAGAEIRDCFVWAYGTGFPKSHDLSKAITTDAARRWSGWGTALKPAWEPAVMARKPFGGTVAGNVLEWGTGAINVDGCRVGTEVVRSSGSTGMDARRYAHGTRPQDYGASQPPSEHAGRWPANLIHDGSAPVLELFPRAAHRFFYTSKASRADRGLGNTHPTVKPSDLMAYACRLVTPPGGLVLDPFMGSGSTGVGALREGFRFLGIDRDPEYVEIARRRLEGEPCRSAV
jgi:site-specific DNA-methyltransferase (adenine-specific)